MDRCPECPIPSWMETECAICPLFDEEMDDWEEFDDDEI